MIAAIASASLLGVDGHAVTVEAQVSPGLPGVSIVGLPDAACREARDRVRSALVSSGLPWPRRRATVNLAPPTLRKLGSGLDLPIAVALLVAMGELAPPGDVAFVGELGLDGSLRAVPGIVCRVGATQAAAVVVPAERAGEAAAAGGPRVLAARDLAGVVAGLRGEAPWEPVPAVPAAQACPCGPDLADVRGQPLARLALEVAAAGGHHLLLSGPPGAGKTMLAARLPGILPPLTPAEVLETTRVHSAAGLALPEGGVVRRPPFRAPHHGASAVSLVGGGSAAMRPGEISLATNGVLFLDELGEFPASVLDALRQPLEEGVVRVARAAAAVTLPARFLLVAATNPCPCGQSGRPGACQCGPGALARYRRRLSGPLLDRFDLRVEVPRPAIGDLLGTGPGESSAAVAARVAAARSLAVTRGVPVNAALAPGGLDASAPLHPDARSALQAALAHGRLSARGLHRVRRVARTVADLAGHDGPVRVDDVSLALALRAATPAESLQAAG